MKAGQAESMSRAQDGTVRIADVAKDARTRPVVKLFGLGLTFVSRSEARRLLDGLDQGFEEVEVDFSGVQDVGQGFVDELLRVWPNAHAGKKVTPVNMNPAVDFMVNRGLARSQESSD